MKKSEALELWKSLEENQDPLPHMNAIEYKAKGSRFGACGIRIDGTPEFIDAVLSNLKSLIDGENDDTRLELARNEVKPTDINGQKKSFVNSEQNAEVCYIRLHQRGHEARHVNRMVTSARQSAKNKRQFDEYVVEITKQSFSEQRIERSITVWIEEYPHNECDSFAVVGKFPSSDEFSISDLMNKEGATDFLNELKPYLKSIKITCTEKVKTSESVENICDNLKNLTS